MAKIAKTADRKKVMDTSKSTDCPKCGKPTRIVKRVKDRERGVPEGFLFPARRVSFSKSCRRTAPSLGLSGMAAGGETAIAFAAWLSHPTKPKYLTTFEMKGHIGGHFDRRTIADCRAESPATEQLDSFLIQVRTVGTIDA